MVKAACHRILGDAALAEDATQEVFLLLVRKLPSLPSQTILGGWLYVTACHLARTCKRTQVRRWQRENQAEITEHVMEPAQDTLWSELEPLLDDALLTLSQRQRELVLLRYFQNNSQRAAACLVGCSESVASRELAAAIQRLRGFFSRHGVTVSATALITLLTTHGAEASICAATVAATLSSASAHAGPSAIGTPLLLALMKVTTTTKVMIGAAAILITFGTVKHLTRRDDPSVQPETANQPALATSDRSEAARDTAKTPASPFQSASSRTLRPPVLPEGASAAVVYDETTLKTARENQQKFFQRMGQLALINDPRKVQELLVSEYGIRLSEDEIRNLQERGPKGFTLGIIDLWAANQPQEALAWAASVYSGPIGAGVDLHQSLLSERRKRFEP